MRTARALAAIAIAVLLVYGGYRLFVHAGNLQPAIVTPHMDAEQAVSESPGGKIKRLFREHVTYRNRSGRPKLIALTFDDGPYPVFTPLLLDELGALKIPATFFLIGHDAQQWPAITQAIARDGDEIANHTYTHPDLEAESPSQVRAEIAGGRDALLALVDAPSIRRFFRPPHGRYTVRTIEVAQSMRYDTILWNDDGGDWRSVTAASLAAHIERYATAPDIVLLHNGKPATIAMLPVIAARFRAAGYRFVTVGQLIASVPVDDVNHPSKHPV